MSTHNICFYYPLINYHQIPSLSVPLFIVTFGDINQKINADSENSILKHAEKMIACRNYRADHSSS